MKTTVKISFVILFISLFISGCAKLLNDTFDDATGKLQSSTGIDNLDKKDDGNGPQNDNSISYEYLTVNNFHSVYWDDYSVYKVNAGSDMTLKFSALAGYFLKLKYYDSKNNSWLSYCNQYNETAGSASLYLYNDSENGVLEYSCDGWTDIRGSFYTTTNYSLVLKPSQSGYVSFYAYLVPLPENLSEYSIENSRANSTGYFVNQYLYSHSSSWKILVDSETTYTLQFYDVETKDGSGITDSYNHYTYIDGVATVYNEYGDTILISDSDSENSFTAESSGYYVLSVQKAGSHIEDGYVAFRLYRN